MTIAQQLKIKDFPFKISDSKGNQIYYENAKGFWAKSEFDSNGNEIYFEDSNGYWYKCEYDSEDNLIYYENSTGTVIDARPKSQKTELTLNEIAQKFGIPVNQLKIKK